MESRLTRDRQPTRTTAATAFVLSRLPRGDATSVALYTWPRPDRAVKATVQIAHGLAEHSARYDRVAQALTSAGYAVYASDHRGHGQTAQGPQELGFFADEDGWSKLVADLALVNRHIAAQYPSLPRVLFGHSFGSFLSQTFLYTHGEQVSAVVLSGTNTGSTTSLKLGLTLAHLERLRVGPRKPSRLLQELSFGSYNRRFEPVRTNYDWLSRDGAEVDKYVADPLCGFDTTTQGFIDLLGGLIRNADPDNQRLVPKQMPIYIFAGDQDPVGRAGRGPTELGAAYERAGLRRVSLKLYPGGRHEMLNETNRDEVVTDLTTWLDTNVRK